MYCSCTLFRWMGKIPWQENETEIRMAGPFVIEKCHLGLFFSLMALAFASHVIAQELLIVADTLWMSSRII